MCHVAGTLRCRAKRYAKRPSACRLPFAFLKKGASGMLKSTRLLCALWQKEFAIERGKLLAARMEQALGFDDMRDAVLQGRICWKVCLHSYG
jgi:hypothetical protein